MSEYIYNPNVFNFEDINDAKNIVLTNEDGVSTTNRWESETPWLDNLISSRLNPHSVLLDYGCGVGRMAKRMSQQHLVIGVDFSEMMRKHAVSYVGDENFAAVGPETFDVLVKAGLRFDGALAIWVLQHCFDLGTVIERIYKALTIGGILAVADMHHRAVPTNHGWVNDGISVRDALLKKFSLIEMLPFTPPGVPNSLRENAFFAIYKKNK